MELPGYYYDAVKKRYFKGSRPSQPLMINDKAPLSSCNAPEPISLYIRQRRIRPDRHDPLSRFTQIKSEINIPAHVQPIKHISFSPCGNLSFGFNIFLIHRCCSDAFGASRFFSTLSCRFFIKFTENMSNF